jgi:RNA polymerase sigma factor (sigma-70 family)
LIAKHIHRTAPASMTKGVALMNPCDKIGSPSTADNGRDKQSDGLLLLAARSGSSQAFVELSKPHSKRILLTLYRITKNWQDAEDAFQETLLKAFLHLDSFQGKASFSTWFTSIAVNTAFMLLRKRRGVPEIAINNVGEAGAPHEWDLKDPRDNPEQCFKRQQRADLLRSGILQLPPELRRVVELQHSRDLSNEEIARCLGISLAATKSRLLRARTALRLFVQRKAGKPPASTEPVWVKQPAFPRNSGNDIKASPTRRKGRNHRTPDSIEHNFVPVKEMGPRSRETIRLGDEELSMVGGR